MFKLEKKQREKNITLNCPNLPHLWGERDDALFPAGWVTIFHSLLLYWFYDIKDMQHWNKNSPKMFQFLLHPLTYTRQFETVQIYPSQPILKHKVMSCLLAVTRGQWSVSSPWSGKTCGRCSLLSGRMSWDQWRTRNMISGMLLW